jgi:drug/metabolite transporter (DMT)-like permease
MTVPASESRKYLLFLSFGAFCISFAAIFVKLVGRGLMGPTAIGFWRAIFGAALLFAWAVLRRSRLGIAWPLLRWLVLAGFIFFLDLFFWHRSILYSGAGMATILANTQVFGTAVLSFFVFKEKLSLRFFLAAVGAIAGIVLLIGIGSGFELTPLYLRGVLFGLITGVAYAGYLVTIKFAGHRLEDADIIVLMAWTSLFTALCLGVAGVIEGEAMLPPSLYAVFVLFSLALVAQTLGWWAIASSLPHIAGSRSGLILLLQPVLATLWGVVFFGEYLTWVQMFGAVITLTAIYFGSVRQSDRPVDA